MGAIFFFIAMCIAFAIVPPVLLFVCYIYDRKTKRTKLSLFQYMKKYM